MFPRVKLGFHSRWILVWIVESNLSMLAFPFPLYLELIESLGQVEE